MAAIPRAAGANPLLSRLRAILTIKKFNHTLVEGERQPQLHAEMGSSSAFDPGQIEFSNWRKVDSRNYGISRSMIPASPWIVLKVLRSEGFEAYLVGGCIRDLLLNRTPKDFDIITTANLKQIRKQFNRCEIVGRRFPICRVHLKGSVVEVSSFETVAKHSKGKKKFMISQVPPGYDEKDVLRWRNSLHRDFTINSLFFDPFVNKIYDYANAMMDLKSLKLRTLIPAELSFEEDCARILRGLRIAARLKLSLSKDAEMAVRKLSVSVKSLDKSRIMMELNYMLSYGASESSLRLLERFGLLQILLPFHAAHLNHHDVEQPGRKSSMLMKLFCNLDQLVTCDKPSDSSLWVALLGFHLALVNSPRDVLVVLTFASVLYHGNWNAGVGFARDHAETAHTYVEISYCHDLLSDEELAEQITQFAVQVQNSVDALTEKDSLLQTMTRFPGFPCSGLVFVSKRMGQNVKQIFSVLVGDITLLKTERKNLDIDYESLGKGNIRESRFVLGRIILDTMGQRDGLHSLPLKENLDMGENLRIQMDLSNKQSTSPSDIYEHQRSAKKQKLSRKNSNFPETNLKKKGLEEMKPKNEKSLHLNEDRSCFDEMMNQQKMTTQGNGSQPLNEMVESVKDQLQQQKLTEKMVDEESDNSESLQKVLKKSNKASEKQQNSIENIHLSREEAVEEIDPQRSGLAPDTQQHKLEKGKRKGNKNLLSSFFR